MEDELLKITKKSNTEDVVKELICRELLRKKNKCLFEKKVFEKK